MRSRRHERGAAMIEFAIVAPIFVMMLMYSMYFTELIRTRLKAQEIARYVTWQMSSFDLSVYGQSNGQAQAFDDAMKEIKEESELRYKDLDSIEDLGPSAAGMFAYENLEVKIVNQDVEFIDTNILEQFNVPGNDLLGSITGAVGGGVNWILNQWGFDKKGRVQIEVSVDLSQKLFSKNLQMRSEKKGFAEVDAWGGRDLTTKTFKNSITMTVDDWHMTDGTNAIMDSDKRKRAGTREESDGKDDRHVLSTQVNRMKMLGLTGALNDITGGFLNFLSGILPSPLNTFTVSHNYKERGDGATPCGQPKHGAAEGMNNLADDKVSGFTDDDDPGQSQRCFDTVPFRDTHQYSRSRYRQMFEARGEFGMGCWNAQATEPTTVSSSTAGSDEAPNFNCGPAPKLP
jgi:hypothetical protein